MCVIVKSREANAAVPWARGSPAEAPKKAPKPTSGHKALFSNIPENTATHVSQRVQKTETPGTCGHTTSVPVTVVTVQHAWCLGFLIPMRFKSWEVMVQPSGARVTSRVTSASLRCSWCGHIANCVQPSLALHTSSLPVKNRASHQRSKRTLHANRVS